MIEKELIRVRGGTHYTQAEIEEKVQSFFFRDAWEKNLDRGKSTGSCWHLKNCTDMRVQLPNTTMRVQARHVSWFFSRGVWPTLSISSRCRNSACVNPDHLLGFRSKGNGSREPAKKPTEADTGFSRLVTEYAETLKIAAGRQGYATMSEEQRENLRKALRFLRLVVSQTLNGMGKGEQKE